MATQTSGISEDVRPIKEHSSPRFGPRGVPLNKNIQQDQPSPTAKENEAVEVFQKTAANVPVDFNTQNLRDLLPEFLLQEGEATPDQIQEAIKEQEKTGRFIGEILSEWGILAEKHLVPLLVNSCRIPYLSLLDYIIDESVVALIPGDICWKYHVLPIDKMGRSLTLAMVNPLNQEALNIVTNLCPDLKIKPILCEHHGFETVAGKLFGPREGHDDITWTHIPELETVPLGVNPMVLQRFSSAHVPLHPKQTTHEDTAKQPSTEHENPCSSENMLLDTNLLVATLLSDSVKSSSIDGSEPTRQKTNHPDTGPKGTRREEGGEKQYQADEIVSQYCNTNDLSLKIADIMLDSMYSTYILLTRKIPFFKGLSPESVARIYSGKHLKVYDANEVIYEQGDSGTFVYVVLNGKIDVLENGKQVATFERGEIFGELALAGEPYRSETTMAQVKSVVLCLNPATIQTELCPEAQAQVLLNMLISLSARCKKNRRPE